MSINGQILVASDMKCKAVSGSKSQIDAANPGWKDPNFDDSSWPNSVVCACLIRATHSFMSNLQQLGQTHAVSLNSLRCIFFLQPASNPTPAQISGANKSNVLWVSGNSYKIICRVEIF